MTHYFNPSSRFPRQKKGQVSINCNCGFMMVYDSYADVFECEKCGIRCTPEHIIALLRKNRGFE